MRHLCIACDFSTGTWYAQYASGTSTTLVTDTAFFDVFVFEVRSKHRSSVGILWFRDETRCDVRLHAAPVRHRDRERARAVGAAIASGMGSNDSNRRLLY